VRACVRCTLKVRTCDERLTSPYSSRIFIHILAARACMLELIDLAIINITGSRAIKANADDRWRRTIVDAEVR